jgi:hypothetical protein
MTAAGVVPITWQVLMGEWQRDWAREDTVGGLAGVMAEHGGATGIAFAWEMQLLAGGGAPHPVDSEQRATRSRAVQPVALA